MAEIGSAFVSILPSAKGFGSSLQSQTSSETGKAGSFLGGVLGKGLLIGFAAVGVAAGIGKALYEVGSTFDDLSDTIRIQTGKSGAALEGLTDVATNVGKQVPVAFDQIGPVVADLNRRLGLTGKPLQQLSKQFLELGHLTGEAIDTQTLTGAFNVFGIKGENASKVMDELFRVTQSTGIGFGDLASNLQRNGANLSQFGFSIQESASLIGTLDKAGLDSNRTLATLSKAMVTFAKDGEDPQKALTGTVKQIQSLVKVGDQAGAVNLAGKVFGTRGATQFVAALKSGRVDINNLTKATSGNNDTIDKAAEATADFSEQWQLFKNRVIVALEPVAARVFNAVGKGATVLNRQLMPAVRAVKDAVTPLAIELRNTLQPALEQVFGFFKANPKVLAVIGAVFLALVSPVALVGAGLAVLYARSQRFRDGFAAVVATLQDFGRRAAPVVASALASIQQFVTTKVIPAVVQLAGVFQTKVIPAVVAAAQFFASRIVPAFIQYVGIVRTQVLPTLAALAQFFVTRIVPVISDVAQSVTTSLRPTFEQLVDTFTTKVLPGVSRLLAKFEEARPTIQRIVEVLAKVIANNIKLTAAVAGKVLPVFIRLTAFLGGKFASAIIDAVGNFFRGAQGAIDFGKKLVGVVRDAAQFASGVIDKAKKVQKFFAELPGKITGFFKSLPSELSRIGGQLIDGLVRGLTSAGHRVTDYVQSLINKIPKKIRSLMGIASPSKVTTKLGEQIGDGLRVGLERSAAGAGKAADKVAKKVKERISKLRDDLTSARSDFAALVDPIAANFTSGLFDFDNAGAFTANLNTVKGTLTTLLGNFKTLIGEGLSPGFLYKLFESGGPGLINSLAALPKADAVAAGALFGEVTSLSDQLGSAVARSTDKGAALETQTAKLEAKLEKLIKSGEKNATMIANSLTEPAKRARRRAVMAG